MPPNQQPVGAPAPAPAPAPQPAAPVMDPSSPPPFSLGTPGEQPQPAPAPAPADEMPAWAQSFVTQVSEKITGLEATIGQPAAAPVGEQPIGAPAPTSELAKRNPQSWEDVDSYVNEAITNGVQRGIQEFTQSLQDSNAQAVQAQQAVDAELDAQVSDLEKAGALPPITNPNDRNDPGRIYRRELYGAAAKLGTTDLKAVATLTLAPLHAQGKLYDPVSDSVIDYAAPQPGATAPIGSSTATTGMNTGAPSYADIHKARSFDELRARAGI